MIFQVNCFDEIGFIHLPPLLLLLRLLLVLVLFLLWLLLLVLVLLLVLRFSICELTTIELYMVVNSYGCHHTCPNQRKEIKLEWQRMALFQPRVSTVTFSNLHTLVRKQCIGIRYIETKRLLLCYHCVCIVCVTSHLLAYCMPSNCSTDL